MEISAAWPWWIAAFVVFRILDIWKPWPIRPLQGLKGGLGVVADDVAAAVITGLLLAGVRMLRG
jgi:phosphatidylglycerophosphatase A